MIVIITRSRFAPGPGVQDEYYEMAREMSELARSIPGYIPHKGFVAEDGEKATIVEFESEEALHEWSVHPRHLWRRSSASRSSSAPSNTRSANVTRARSWESKADKP